MAILRPAWWWLVALCAFGAACAIVVLSTAALHSGGNGLEAPPALTVPGASFHVGRGSGHRSGSAVVVQSVDGTGIAVVAADVPEFTAERYPNVEWRLRSSGPVPPAVAFAWRTREQPGVTFSTPLEWTGDRVAPLRLQANARWSGSIVGVGLIVRGPLATPLLVESVHVPGVSAITAADDLRRQWNTFFGFGGHSIAFPFDEERRHTLSLLAAVALAAGLAIAAYLLVAHWRGRPPDRRVLWAMFLAGWLVLDMRWQANLGRQLVQTAEAFAGRDDEAKHRAAADRELFALMGEVLHALPAPPARLLVLSDSRPLRIRGAFFLYPHNVNAAYQESRRTAQAPVPDDFRSGDHVLLFLYGALRYDREQGLLVWASGARRQVDELWWKSDGVALLRVR